MSAKVRKQSSNTGFIVALVGIVAAGGGFIWWKTQQKPEMPTIALASVADTLLASKAQGYTIGSPEAKVEIVEFADFECPACGRFATLTEPDVRKNLVQTGLVKYTFYDWPILAAHKNTIPASMSAACANDQGKFWEMHDALFNGQYDWSGIATDNPRKLMTGYAEQIGLDMAKWNACMDASTHAERIKANHALGMTKMVRSTPTLFINGQQYEGALPYDDIKKAVDAALAATLPIPAAAPEPKKESGATK